MNSSSFNYCTICQLYFHHRDHVTLDNCPLCNTKDYFIKIYPADVDTTSVIIGGRIDCVVPGEEINVIYAATSVDDDGE